MGLSVYTEMEKSGIYEIRNLVNNKVYGGSSTRLRKRFGEHRRKLRAGTHKNPHLQAAWNKYGPDAFRFRILALVEPTDLEATEQRLLDVLFTDGNCYNLERVVGRPMYGRKLTPEQVELNRQRRLEYYANGGVSPNKGKVPSPEVRQRMSEAQRRRAQKGFTNRGMTHSAETREKIRAAALRRFAVYPNPKTGKPVSQETREAMSRAAKLRERPLKSHCKRGHAFEGDNVIQVPNGRRCRTCKQIEAREYQRRKRANKAV